MSATKPAAGTKPAAPEKSSKPVAVTEYVVLVSAGSGDVDHFDVVGKASGVTDTKAIEKARATLPEGQQGLAFVAVPVRSWRVRTPQIKTTVKTLWT